MVLLMYLLMTEKKTGKYFFKSQLKQQLKERAERNLSRGCQNDFLLKECFKQNRSNHDDMRFRWRKY